MSPEENAKFWDFENKIHIGIANNTNDEALHLYVKRQKLFGLHLIDSFTKLTRFLARNEVSQTGFYNNLNAYFGKNPNGTKTFMKQQKYLINSDFQYWYIAAFPDVITWFISQEINDSVVYNEIIDYLKENDSYFPNQKFPFDDFSMQKIIDKYYEDTSEQLELNCRNFD